MRENRRESSRCRAAEENGEDWLKTHPVGTGPFVFENWQSGDRLEVTRNESYWQRGEDGEPLPYLDRVTYRVIIEVSTQFAEMRAGTADLMTNVPGRDVPAAKEIPHAEYVDAPYLGLKRQYFFNSLEGTVSRQPPTAPSVPSRDRPRGDGARARR